MSGRWQPGESGNPAGRPAGSGELAKLRAGIAERVPEILSKLIDAAIAGDTQAARLLLERVLPPVKAVELPVALSLPKGRLTVQARHVLAAAAGGTLAPDQAATLIGVLAGVARIVETDELRDRIERLEASEAGSRR
ncbi:MAG: DUF5681 domain-containing protein [Steroidobacteraceae bacterium]